MTSFKRNKKLISSLQVRLTGSFVAVACMAALFQVLVLNGSITSLARENPDVSDQILALLPGVLAKNVLLTLCLLLPIMITVGILITHRVAGPAYRMEHYLRDVAREGRVAQPCRTRDGDELKDLLDALNAALEAVSTSRDEPELDVEDAPSLVGAEAPSAAAQEA